MAAFQFDTGFQRAILRLMMLDDVFCMRCLEHCEASFFTTEPLGWVFRIFEAYWAEYSQMCTDIPLRGALRHARPEKAYSYHVEIEAVIACGGVPEADYVRHELRDFCRRNLFSQAHQESARLFNAGSTDEAYDVMARAHDAIQRIDFGKIDRQWFFDELSERQQARYRSTFGGGGFGTGITELDALTEGGVHPGEVWSVLAYAKRCKTTWLTNVGFTNTTGQVSPTLHVQLEGQGQEISNKYDALFGEELYTNVKSGNIDPAKYGAMQREYSYKRKQLVIRTLNDWDVNVGHVKAELDELKSHGFRPKVLIVDYVDLLRSRNRVDSETQHQVDASRDLKRLVLSEQLACWTAWQARRPKSDAAHQTEHVLSSANVADAYAKVRIVDSYGSLNATDEEMREGEMRIFWEAHRNAHVNRCWKVSNDLKMQRMVTNVIALDQIDPPDAEEQKS